MKKKNFKTKETILVKNYSFLTGLEKAVLRTIIFAGPMLLDILPETWMNITLSGVIVFLINFAKNYSFDLDEENKN